MYTYPVNPCSFMMIHGNELRQIHLITGAPHDVHGEDLHTSCCESFYAYAWNSLVLVIYMGMNYVKLLGVNPSLIIIG